jgi:hypothetical protein
MPDSVAREPSNLSARDLVSGQVAHLVWCQEHAGRPLISVFMLASFG